jgi:phosphoglycerol transferase MdoB-like AlkP superfamily enzyme
MSIAKPTLVKVVIQIFVVFALSVIGTYIFEKLNYKGYFNLVVFIAVITCIAYVMNRNQSLRLFMFVILCIISFLTVGFTGQVVGYAD